MADITFTDATVLGYNVENYFLGDGTARYGSTKRLSIEVMSYNINVDDFSNEGVSETWDNLKTYLDDGDNFQNIKIKIAGVDWDLGQGIIESIATTEQNPIRVGYHRFNIEIPYSTALPSFGSDNYKGVKEAIELGNGIQELIRDFSESFNFSEDEDGTYTHEHSVSIRFEEGKTLSGTDTEIDLGKNFAEKLFEADYAPPFGFAVRSGSFDDAGVKDKRHYYTETYDAFTKTCSFVKRMTIEDEDEGNYTKKLRLTTNLSADGIIS